MKLKIREIRESRNLSTYQVADLMKIPQPTYSRFERGASKIDLDRLEQFAEVFGMSVVDVIVYPEKFVNVHDIPKELKMYEPDVMIQFKVKAEKRDAVLAAVLGESNVELLKD